ncbi:MAG TPA: hypothetical protein VFI74_02050 [Candidatus Saccharimonadales bacterium]|nr:hypothetical protein [Candidatus Saccharimonadales bacterium]
MPRLVPPAELPRFAFGGVIATKDPAHLPPRVRINTPFNNFVSPTLLRKALSQYPHIAEAIDESLAKTPPPGPLRDTMANGATWSQWLSTAPECGGATDEQHQALMQWNLDEMHAQNEQHGPWLLDAHEEFTSDLEEGVADGRISPRLLKHWHKNGRDATLFIDGPLSTATDTANAYSKYGVVRFTAEFTQGIATHEFLHLAGTFYRHYLNEAGAEYLTRALRNEANLSTYIGHTILLEETLTAAHVNTLEFSQAFAGDRGVANERALRRLVRRKNSADLFGDYLDEADITMHRAQRHHSMGIALTLSAAEMMRRRKTFGTDKEIIQRVGPNLDDEQVQVAISAMHKIYA